MKTTKCNRCHVKHLFLTTISYAVFWFFFVDIFEQTSLLQNADNHKKQESGGGVILNVMFWYDGLLHQLIFGRPKIFCLFIHIIQRPSCLCQKIRYTPELQEATMDEMKSDTGNKSKNGKDLAPGAHKLDPHLPPKRLGYPCLLAI